MAGEREGVLVRAADVVRDRDAFGVGAHVAVLDRAPQPVVDGRVDQLAVAEAKAEPGARDEVRGAVHRLHPAGDRELRVARPDLGGGEHDRLEARPADAVDGRGGGAVREARLERRLPGGCLAGAGLEDLAHQDLVDLRCRRVQARALDGRPDRDAAELRGRHGGQRAAELADRRSRRADEIDVAVRAGGGVGHALESTPSPLSTSSATISRWIWLVPS